MVCFCSKNIFEFCIWIGSWVLVNSILCICSMTLTIQLCSSYWFKTENFKESDILLRFFNIKMRTDIFNGCSLKYFWVVLYLCLYCSYKVNICPCIYLSFCLYISLSIHLFIHLFIFLSIYPFMYQYIYLFICLSIKTMSNQTLLIFSRGMNDKHRTISVLSA